MHVRRREEHPRARLDRSTTELEALVDRLGAVVTRRDDMRMNVDEPRRCHLHPQCQLRPTPCGITKRLEAPCAMIVTMVYDEDLADRIGELIASDDGYAEQKMLGGRALPSRT